jgi:acyl-CoA reductase-like NAD-dependent aldehyde dehydrogenase
VWSLARLGPDPHRLWRDGRGSWFRSGVDKIVFTGSVPNGRRVLEGSVQNLTPVVLELGGKDPLIVCDDADLSQAVAGALAGVFICSGQMCLAAERIYVMDGIYDRFIERVVAEARALRQGDPLAGNGADIDVGAMTMPHQVEIVEQLVADAVRKGAKVLVGGERRPGGNFYKPTVLVEVDHTMDIMREETFGPVMAIMRVRDDDHAIELANDSVFGLGSTVFSKDQARARRLADRLIAGSTCINDYGLAYMVQGLPFGGVRSSGFGRLNGREGLRACCNAKAVRRGPLPNSHSVEDLSGQAGRLRNGAGSGEPDLSATRSVGNQGAGPSAGRGRPSQPGLG